MSKREMTTVRISEPAKSDLRSIAEFSADVFGETQATRYLDGIFEQFALLGEYPGIGLPVLSRLYGPSFRFGYASHIIIYSYEQDNIMIRRVLHGSVDLERHI